MGKINYYEWLRGGCGCGHYSPDVKPTDSCDCDKLLLEISKLHTDDLILQDEIDDLSGVVETKLDASAYTPVDLTEYATKQWVEDKGYLTTVQPLKTINGISVIGEGNINVSGTSIDAYTKAESDDRYQPKGDYALRSEIPSLSGYVTNSTLIQYITNLQEQIDSLKSQVSGCCGSSGETTYRWITLTGENDYWCSGTTKYSKEKEQSSTDGINWVDTGNIRNGSTILEENCVECGYIPPTPSGDSNANIDLYFDTQNRLSGKTTYKTSNICYGDVITTKLCVYYGAGSTSTRCEEYNQCYTSFTSNDIDSIALNSYGFGTEITKSTGEIKANEFNNTDAHGVLIHSGVTSIGDYAFANNEYLEEVGRPQLYPVVNPKYLLNLTSIGNYAFANSPELTTVYLNGLNAGVPTLGNGAFSNCPKLTHIYVDGNLVTQFKSAPRWSQYANIIQAIS